MNKNKTGYFARQLIAILATLMCLFCVATEAHDKKTESLPPKKIIVTSSTPLASMIANITGENFDVYAINSGNTCPCEFVASPSDKNLIAKADLVVYISEDFDSFMLSLLGNYVNPTIIVSKMKSIDFLGAQGKINWHFWFNLSNALNFMRDFTEQISQIFPENATSFMVNFNRSVKKIYELDSFRQKQMKRLPEMIVFTDSMDHFFNKKISGTFSIIRMYYNNRVSLKFYDTLHKTARPDQCFILDENQSESFLSRYKNQKVKVPSENWPAVNGESISPNLFFDKYTEIVENISRCF